MFVGMMAECIDVEVPCSGLTLAKAANCVGDVTVGALPIAIP